MLKLVAMACAALIAASGTAATAIAASPPIRMTIHPVAHFGLDHSVIEVATTITCDPTQVGMAAEVTVQQKRGAHIVRATTDTNSSALCDGQPHAVSFELWGASCNPKGASCHYWRKGMAVSSGIVQWAGVDGILYSHSITAAPMTIVN